MTGRGAFQCVRGTRRLRFAAAGLSRPRCCSSAGPAQWLGAFHRFPCPGLSKPSLIMPATSKAASCPCASGQEGFVVLTVHEIGQDPLPHGQARTGSI